MGAWKQELNNLTEELLRTSTYEQALNRYKVDVLKSFNRAPILLGTPEGDAAYLLIAANNAVLQRFLASRSREENKLFKREMKKFEADCKAM